MRAKTKTGKQLKRLAYRYAEAYSEGVIAYLDSKTEGGIFDSVQCEEIKRKCNKAEKKLFDAIDELTSADLTQRAVQEME